MVARRPTLSERSDDGRADHGEHGERAQHPSTQRQRGVLGIDEIGDGKCLEREDRRVEDDTQSDEVPVGEIEGLHIGEDDLVLLAFGRQRRGFLRAHFEDVVTDCADDA